MAHKPLDVVQKYDGGVRRDGIIRDASERVEAALLGRAAEVVRRENTHVGKVGKRREAGSEGGRARSVSITALWFIQLPWVSM